MSAPFNPAAWLQAFVTAGGHYVVNADNRIAVGWSLDGLTAGEQIHAEQLFTEVRGDAHKAAAVREHLIARQRIPA